MENGISIFIFKFKLLFYITIAITAVIVIPSALLNDFPSLTYV